MILTFNFRERYFLILLLNQIIELISLLARCLRYALHYEVYLEFLRSVSKHVTLCIINIVDLVFLNSRA